MKNIKISIILPNYNSDRYIGETIKSVLKQNYKLWELIIIDDNSKDNSIKIINNFVKKDKRVKLIKLKNNFGPAYARNQGLNAARGEYISFIDSDDTWKKNKLRFQLEFMKKNNLKFTCTSYIAFKNKNSIISKIKPKSFYNFKNFVKDTTIATSSMILKKEIIGATRFKSGYKFDDYIFKCEILKKNFFCYNCNHFLLNYRVRNKSISSNIFTNLYWIFVINYKIFKFSIVKNIYSLFLVSYNSIKKYKLKINL